MSLTAFRCTSLTQDYNLELQYRKPFLDIWQEEKDGPILGPLSVRMGVRARGDGPMLVSEEELEAASKFFDIHCCVFHKYKFPDALAGFYHAFCFYKV